MTEQVTGAQSLILALEAGRGRHGLRHPRRRDPPGVRPAVRLDQDPPHPGPARAGRRARRPGLRRRRPARSASAWRPAAPARPTSSRRSPTPTMDSVPIVAITGQVAERLDRHRRLPGGRHPRHHDADHQAQLPRHRPGRDPARDRRGVLHRRHRAPGPGPRRHRQGRAPGDDDVRVPRRSSSSPATGPSPSRTPSRCARPRG